MDRQHTVTIETHASRLWLITTNDNIRAFFVFQRGMPSSELFTVGLCVPPVKPSIPEIGSNASPSVTRSNPNSD
jgi:hypothetical protein